MKRIPHIAVTGLHRGENPQPGSSIIRSIRRVIPNARIVGLVYDALESGIYADDGPDAVYAMPYPTAGREAFLERIDEILLKEPFEFFIPTLDSEIELMVHLEDELIERGLFTYLPDAAILAKRAKNHLTELAKSCDVNVPETVPVYDVTEAQRAASHLGFPLMVKGQYYDAKKVESPTELSGAVTKLLSEWGAPAILQRCIQGPEFNVLGIGDGEGSTFGLCSLRKTHISDKGKGLGGITIQDSKLNDICARLIKELCWRGPFEIEVMKDEATGEYALIEINPRFPAWVDFPSQFGMNFPAMLVEMISTGMRPKPFPPCEAGHFYMRHQIEVLGHLDQLSALSSEGGFTASVTDRSTVTSRPHFDLQPTFS